MSNLKPKTQAKLGPPSAWHDHGFMTTKDCCALKGLVLHCSRMQAVVEFVASGSRFRVYIPRETCVITFLLSGISCPRASRQMPGGIATPADPFGDEALAFVKEMVLQKEVDIEVSRNSHQLHVCFEASQIQLDGSRSRRSTRAATSSAGCTCPKATPTCQWHWWRRATPRHSVQNGRRTADR